MALLIVAGCGRVGFDATGDAAGDVTPAFDAPDRVAVPIMNPGCENGMMNWTGYGGTLTISSTAHTGAAACQICCAGPGSCTLDDAPNDAVLSPVMGDTYFGEAWVLIGAGAGARSGLVMLREWVSSTDVGSTAGTSAPLTPTWTRVTAMRTVTQPTDTSFDMFVVVDPPMAGECFLIDDIALWRLL